MPKTDKGLTKGSQIPDFQLEDVKGNFYSSEQLKGKPVLLYFLRGTF